MELSRQVYWSGLPSKAETHNKPLVESSFLTRDQDLRLLSGSTDSKTVNYQRTDPAAAAAKSLPLCTTLCDPIDGGPVSLGFSRQEH